MVPGQVFVWIALMVLTTSNGEHRLFMFFRSFSFILQCTWLKIPDFLAFSLVLPVQQCRVMEVAYFRKEHSNSDFFRGGEKEYEALGSSSKKVGAGARCERRFHLRTGASRHRSVGTRCPEQRAGGSVRPACTACSCAPAAQGRSLVPKRSGCDPDSTAAPLSVTRGGFSSPALPQGPSAQSLWCSRRGSRSPPAAAGLCSEVPPLHVLSSKHRGTRSVPRVPAYRTAAVYPITPQDTLIIHCKNATAAESSRKLQISLNTKVKRALNYALQWLPG